MSLFMLWLVWRGLQIKDLSEEVSFLFGSQKAIGFLWQQKRGGI